MTETNLLNGIHLSITHYAANHSNKKPAYIYLGVDEMDILERSIVFKMQNRALTPSKPWSIFGVEIVPVHLKSFLEVGGKNEIS
ncbi:hypothetical protein AVV20_gp30 [Bacillus phage Palmer]|uniref:Uncharacterized protein n=1 Tax=Bacillus phage Palmer TaxID=1597966 RepID=A0A0C5AFH0_9CAUD|nr:hypothetical protein AVV20_gp30 [Bacillus phage Palmer]AJK28097.1 hypothetical protein CPT_Palmer30 [Bacillus phage Palmer]